MKRKKNEDANEKRGKGNPSKRDTGEAETPKKSRQPSPRGPSSEHERPSSKRGSQWALLQAIAKRLPFGKLTAAQTHNLASDLVGAVLCGLFILRSDNHVLSFVSIIGVLLLSYVCMIATDRRRRF